MSLKVEEPLCENFDEFISKSLFDAGCFWDSPFSANLCNVIPSSPNGGSEFFEILKDFPVVLENPTEERFLSDLTSSSCKASQTITQQQSTPQLQDAKICDDPGLNDTEIFKLTFLKSDNCKNLAILSEQGIVALNPSKTLLKVNLQTFSQQYTTDPGFDRGNAIKRFKKNLGKEIKLGSPYHDSRFCNVNHNLRRQEKYQLLRDEFNTVTIMPKKRKSP